MKLLRALLIALIFTMMSPGAGWSTNMFFDANLVAGDWNDDANWIENGETVGWIPTASDSVYITTSDDPAAWLWSAIAEIEAFSADSASLYIGGWPSNFDGDEPLEPGQHGPPAGRIGELRLNLGGSIDSGTSYIRVGMRGAKGTIIQSGGDVISTSRTGPTLGFGSDTSIGIHDLNLGTLNTRGVSVGLQGLGRFTMSGGDFVESCAGCRSTIGGGYLVADQTSEGEIPGIGLMVQSGGTFTGSNMNLGTEAGSVGVLFVHSGAVHTIGTRMYVGRAGTGSVVQTGGSVSVGWCLELGSLDGALGSYTIEDGELDQFGQNPTTSRCNKTTGGEGVYVGAGGVGTLHVLGNEAVISFGRYHQSADSTLAFTIDDNVVPDNAVSTIQVDTTANFEVGAKIRVAIPATVAGGVPAIIRPSSVELMTATQGFTGITDASDLVLVGPEAGTWTLSIVNGAGSEQTLVASTGS